MNNRTNAKTFSQAATLAFGPESVSVFAGLFLVLLLRILT